MGLDISRIVFEDQSRNTLENAVFSYKLLSPKSSERWVLITSASHMPRSVGTFRKAGWKPIPFPVDFSTYEPGQLRIGFNIVSALNRFGAGLRTWSALLVYRLLGRMDEIFPGPDSVGQSGS
jgi:uncharacterized SAM-binding protein YcdF (DUF218 family)